VSNEKNISSMDGSSRRIFFTVNWVNLPACRIFRYSSGFDVRKFVIWSDSDCSVCCNGAVTSEDP